jgi:SAM-dependent methyltransferase
MRASTAPPRPREDAADDRERSTVGWEMVDEGWGRRAVDFATLIEPAQVREYVAVFRRLGVGPGVRLLDMACGAGLALEIAGVLGAERAGIDASSRLAEVARLRNPGCDVRVGDMADSGFDDASFEAVTSFRGIWGTTPGAVREACRLLVPGGRFALTCWGDMASMPGGRLLAPFRLAAPAQVEHQSDMVALKRPGAAAAFLSDAGLEPEESFAVPFVFEFADAEHYARGLASTGPAYEAIQVVGEEAFHDACVEAAQPFLADGRPIRGELPLWGITARRPA